MSDTMLVAGYSVQAQGFPEHDIKGFMNHDRVTLSYQSVAERIRHWGEFTIPLENTALQIQAKRCMDCGVPYCHGDTKTSGCPTNNQIPDFNAMVRAGDWQGALVNLHSTNNFPEFTGRTCPAPCEDACVLNLDGTPVTIKNIENAIIERGWAEGWVVAEPPAVETGKRVAIVGSGPAGLAAAQQLRRAGHEVTVFEKNAKAGGLLRYGIPDFKLEKHVIDRRVAQMQAEGVTFIFNTEIGEQIAANVLPEMFDAVILAAGAEVPYDVKGENRSLGGIHYAMEYLVQNNRAVSGEGHDGTLIHARGKHVVVVGGGDTGADCIGTAVRQGAASITQITRGPEPDAADVLQVWPRTPQRAALSSSHIEAGGARHFSVVPHAFEGVGTVSQLVCMRTDQNRKVIAGSEFRMNADLVLLAVGFAHTSHNGLVKGLGVALDGKGHVKAELDDYRTSVDKVYAGGDMRRGASLVVWAIREGRGMAQEVDWALRGYASTLQDSAHAAPGRFATVYAPAAKAPVLAR